MPPSLRRRRSERTHRTVETSVLEGSRSNIVAPTVTAARDSGGATLTSFVSFIAFISFIHPDPDFSTARQLFIGVASPSRETWAATMRQPSGVRIQVWLWRPGLAAP